MKPNLKTKPLPLSNSKIETPQPQQKSFKEYMEEQLKQTDISSQFEGVKKKFNIDLMEQKPPKKPFQIKQSSTSQSFASSCRSKTSYQNKFKTIDPQLSRTISDGKALTASHMSTQKSEQQSNNENEQNETDLDKKLEQLTSNLQNLYFERLKNDSFLSNKEKSLFITELLKNRQVIHTGQIEEPNILQEQQSQVEEIESRVEEFNNKLKKLQEEVFPQDYQNRLYELTNKDNKSLFIDNPYDINQEQNRIIDQQIKKFNPQYIENADLELDQPGVLPKDKFLRKEAMERIIQIKTQECNQELMKLALKTGLEEKPKMQAMVDKVMKNSNYQPSEFLVLKLKQFEQLENISQNAKDLLAKLQGDYGEEILKECEQEKIQLDEAIKLSHQLLRQSDESDFEQQIESLKQKKRELEELERNLLPIDSLQVIKEVEESQYDEEQHLEQLKLEQIDIQQPTIDDLDKQIEEQIKQKYPELFVIEQDYD